MDQKQYLGDVCSSCYDKLIKEHQDQTLEKVEEGYCSCSEVRDGFEEPTPCDRCKDKLCPSMLFPVYIT